MTTTTIREEQHLATNRILHGDCIEVMQQMPAASIDFILTDPPYLVNYRDRTGRTLPNDCDAEWLKPAMAAAFRVLKQDRLMACFYGWPRADDFLDAWRSAGFRPVGHFVFRKSYTSSARYMKCQHEQAYLLAKGRPPLGFPVFHVLSCACMSSPIPRQIRWKLFARTPPSAAAFPV